jgi:hypothetical protein
MDFPPICGGETLQSAMNVEHLNRQRAGGWLAGIERHDHCVALTRPRRVWIRAELADVLFADRNNDQPL